MLIVGTNKSIQIRFLNPWNYIRKQYKNLTSFSDMASNSAASELFASDSESNFLPSSSPNKLSRNYSSIFQRDILMANCEFFTMILIVKLYLYWSFYNIILLSIKPGYVQQKLLYEYFVLDKIFLNRLAEFCHFSFPFSNSSVGCIKSLLCEWTGCKYVYYICLPSSTLPCGVYLAYEVFLWAKSCL